MSSSSTINAFVKNRGMSKSSIAQYEKFLAPSGLSLSEAMGAYKGETDGIIDIAGDKMFHDDLYDFVGENQRSYDNPRDLEKRVQDPKKPPSDYDNVFGLIPSQHYKPGVLEGDTPAIHRYSGILPTGFLDAGQAMSYNKNTDPHIQGDMMDRLDAKKISYMPDQATYDGVALVQTADNSFLQSANLFRMRPFTRVTDADRNALPPLATGETDHPESYKNDPMKHKPEGVPHNAHDPKVAANKIPKNAKGYYGTVVKAGASAVKGAAMKAVDAIKKHPAGIAADIAVNVVTGKTAKQHIDVMHDKFVKGVDKPDKRPRGTTTEAEAQDGADEYNRWKNRPKDVFPDAVHKTEPTTTKAEKVKVKTKPPPANAKPLPTQVERTRERERKRADREDADEAVRVAQKENIKTVNVTKPTKTIPDKITPAEYTKFLNSLKNTDDGVINIKHIKSNIIQLNGTYQKADDTSIAINKGKVKATGESIIAINRVRSLRHKLLNKIETMLRIAPADQKTELRIAKFKVEESIENANKSNEIYLTQAPNKTEL